MTLPPFVKTTDGGILLHLKIQPGASKTKITGQTEGVDPQTQQPRSFLKIQLAAPPVEGKANDELIRFLSKTLEAPQSQIQLIAGEKSRFKTVQVGSLSASEISQKLGLKMSS